MTRFTAPRQLRGILVPLLLIAWSGLAGAESNLPDFTELVEQHSPAVVIEPVGSCSMPGALCGAGAAGFTHWASVRNISMTSMGLAIWSFMPASRHRSRWPLSCRLPRLPS